MRLLVNYDKEEKRFLPMLGSLLKAAGHQPLVTPAEIKVPALKELKEKGIEAIICCNQASLNSLVEGPKASVTLDNFRGSVLQYDPPVLIVNQLHQIKSVKYGEWLLQRDLKKLNHVTEPIGLPTFDVLERLVDFELAYGILQKALAISIDIETDQLARITCISYTALLDKNKTYSCLIPFHDFGKDHWESDAEFAQALRYMQLFNATEAPKLMFNGTYDAQYCLRYRAPTNNYVIDVMGLAHSEFSELPKTLDFVCSLWDPHFMQWKHESQTARKNNDIRTYWYYCVKDSFNTLKAFLLMMPTFPQYAIKNYQMKFKLTYPCLYCSFEGDKIDAEAKARAAEAAQKKLETALANLRVMANDPNFNPGSWQQIANLIYKILGARPIKGESTNEKILRAVSEQHPLLARFIDDIMVYRKERKAYGTYFTFDELNGRLLYSIGPFGTDTGRANSKASNFWVGTQKQNIPGYAKGMIVADPGYIMHEADNSKAEARIVAVISRCQKLIDALADPEKDFYKILGTIFFGMKYEDVTTDLRNKVMKRIIHGTNYMMGADTLIEVATPQQMREAARLLKYKLTTLKEFATYLLGIYHKHFPEVSKHYSEIQQEILTTHKLVSAMGYTRYFFGDIIGDSGVLRSAVAHEPQNLNVDILNKGFWKVYKYLVLPSNGEFRLKAQIHDSIISQFKIEKQEYYRDRVLALMYNPIKIHGKEFYIPVEDKIGFSWGSMH